MQQSRARRRTRDVRSHGVCVMSRPSWAFILIAVAACAADAGDPSSGNNVPAVPPGTVMPPALPTGPPPEMVMRMQPVTPPPAQADAGAPTATADAGRPGLPDAGPGMVTGMDAAVPMDAMTMMPPPTGGPLNMAPVTFGPNVKVSDDTGRAQQVEVFMAAHPSGLLFAGWMDQRMNPSVCAYSVSKDGGLTWSKNVFAATQATGGRAFAGDPAVAIDDKGNLYAGCQDYASGGLGTNYVLLAHSKDQGATWSEFKRVNQSLDKPWLGGTGDGTVLLTWLGNPGGMKRSTDFGATWAETISLGYINHGTAVSFTNTGLVHVPYNTDETTVSYRRSKDNGVTFEPVRDLTEQGQPCRSPCSPRSHPIIGGDSDPTGKVVAITWASRLEHEDAENDDDVWVIVSYDSGETFSDPIRVNDNMNASRQFQPWVAVDSYGAVHVTWTDMRDNGANATYYARMTDIEKGFEPNVEVTDGTGEANSFLGDYKGIEAVGRDIVVIWTDTRDDSGDIYFARAKDAAAAGGPLMP